MPCVVQINRLWAGNQGIAVRVPSVSNILVQMVDDHDLSVKENEAAAIQNLTENIYGGA